ncbi:MAG: hypothetical protein WA865_17110 [Spirulinaceae cyanobacterium]
MVINSSPKEVSQRNSSSATPISLTEAIAVSTINLNGEYYGYKKEETS